eukprot:scaffold3457_cov133-Chaetoceros_neogracile.AAC.3
MKVCMYSQFDQIAHLASRLYKSDDRIADSHSYLCKYEDRSHIQTHLSPDREESGEDPVEENLFICESLLWAGCGGRGLKLQMKMGEASPAFLNRMELQT